MVKSQRLEEVARLQEQLAAATQAAVQELEEQKRQIDDQLNKLGHGKKGRRKTAARVCSACGRAGHNARACPESERSGKRAEPAA